MKTQILSLAGALVALAGCSSTPTLESEAIVSRKLWEAWWADHLADNPDFGLRPVVPTPRGTVPIGQGATASEASSVGVEAYATPASDASSDGICGIPWQSLFLDATSFAFLDPLAQGDKYAISGESFQQLHPGFAGEANEAFQNIRFELTLTHSVVGVLEGSPWVYWPGCECGTQCYAHVSLGTIEVPPGMPRATLCVEFDNNNAAWNWYDQTSTSSQARRCREIGGP